MMHPCCIITEVLNPRYKAAHKRAVARENSSCYQPGDLLPSNLPPQPSLGEMMRVSGEWDSKEQTI